MGDEKHADMIETELARSEQPGRAEEISTIRESRAEEWRRQAALEMAVEAARNRPAFDGLSVNSLAEALVAVARRLERYVETGQ